MVGVYDKGAKGIQDMLTNGNENKLIPVDNWAAFSEKGGVKGTVEWIPLDQVVLALEKLNIAREAIKGQIYELTGIADIVRGATKASETLGAQQIKAQFASIRIKKLQDEVARFASDIMRLKAEIMVKHFDPEVLMKKSNIMATGDKELVPAALQMLIEDEGFEWRIEVTADSIAQADYAMEKADRLEFISAVTPFLEKTAGMVQANPQTATLLIGMLKWAIAGFRNAAEIEGLFDKELAALEQKAKQPPAPPPPNPEMVKAQAAAAIQKAKMDGDQQKFQMDMQSKQADMEIKKQMAAMDMRMKEMELQFRQRELDMELAAAQQSMQMDQVDAINKQRAQVAQQRMTLQASAMQHEQSLTQSAEAAKMKSKEKSNES